MEILLLDLTIMEICFNFQPMVFIKNQVIILFITINILGTNQTNDIFMCPDTYLIAGRDSDGISIYNE